MKAAILALSVLLSAAVPALAEDPVLPNPNLTPGAVRTEDAGRVCEPGYARSVRHTSGKLKHRIYEDYGIDRRGGHYAIDHLIPLGLGGADDRKNLWPQSFDTEPWNARVKDRLESYLHDMVCAGEVPIEVAQRDIAQDWITAYRKYLGDPAP